MPTHQDATGSPTGSPRAAAAAGADIALMRQIAADGGIPDSASFAGRLGLAHQAVVGVLGSLESGGWIAREVKERTGRVLTAEGERAVRDGTPEAHVMALLRKGPCDQKAAEEKLGAEVLSIGMKQLMPQRLLEATEARPGPGGEGLLAKDAFFAACGCAGSKEPKKDDAAHGAWKAADEKWKAAKDKGKTTLALSKAGAEADWKDVVREQLRALGKGEEMDKKTFDALKKRKLAAEEKIKYFAVSKGPAFPTPFPAGEPWPWNQKAATDVTQQMLADIWARPDEPLPALKAANFNAQGRKPAGGHLHPLMKLRQQYREIFLELGFQEMVTNQFVESSFWNFDTLFVPQKHPARDAQDTFFISDPERSTEHPEEYIESTRDVHSIGKFGSTGYRYNWSREETERNVLRTHTTACSSATLYEIGQEYKRTGKLRTGAFFSIDRVFRNEQMDRTHLCEFHQIEGFVIDYGLSLGHMMALLRQFFEKVGVPQLRFKPTYNPYTEPSMEVHGWHEGLKKVIEVGNSGVFRPEMLLPMGIPEDATVIAWGLGLERPAMMFYKLDSVHDLFGHRVSLPFIKSAAMPRI
eukprot:TRINITY_DN1983_c0_g1_i3.p1 TRINITY_DN1983_c0_g1~~TRINITY_DN1983_c0_g1_i3.p1  ORF type:complete len:616 (+),score=254.66 TRINITY_DN1983_c0_g1_i3:103-1848(+)